MDTDRVLLEGNTTRVLIGAFYAVYNGLGGGFLEHVYENAMLFELRDRGLFAMQQVSIDVRYRGNVVGSYRADLVVPDKVLIEIKAAKMLTAIDEAQLHHYLKATGIPVGLLLNFGPRPQVIRRIRSERLIGSYPCGSVVENDV